MQKIRIDKEDFILDGCCGYGLITKIVAEHCRKIYAVDFSKILTSTAKEKNLSHNIHYFLEDVFDIDKIFLDNCFNKIYCYASFQYVNPHMEKKDWLFETHNI